MNAASQLHSHNDRARKTAQSKWRWARVLPRLEPLEDRSLPSFGGFAAAVTYPTGTFPQGVATGDFDGDTKVDLVTSNITGNSVSVLLGNGNGTFQAKTDYTTGTGPQWVAVGDLDGDTDLDLVTANFSGDSVSVLLGNGNGTFQAKVDYVTGPFSGPRGVALGDLDGDTDLDIAAALEGVDFVGVLLGNGNGTFQSATYSSTAAGTYGIVLGNFDGDTNLDAATSNTNGTSISVLLGNGNGTFQARTDYTMGVGSTPRGIAVADFDGDTDVDIVAANSAGNVASVFLGNGNGTFQARADYTTGAAPWGIAVDDLDDDNTQDIVSANNTDSTVSVLLGNGNGTFQAKLDYSTGASTSPRGLALANFDTDIFPDAATANAGNDTVGVLMNDTLAVPTHFDVVAPATATAGTSFSITVTARTATNQVAADYTGTVTFTSSDGQAVLPSNYTFLLSDAGVKTFNVTLKTAGSQSITTTDTVTPSITGNDTVSVDPAAASTLTATGFPSPVTAGSAQNITITAKDAYNNTATGYTGTVTFTSSDGQATLPSNYTFTGGDAGVHVFSVTLKTAGTQSITATDTVTGTITGSQTGITVDPAAASTLTVAGFPSTVTAGSAQLVTVTAKDVYGNTATGYTGTVTFTSNDPQATLPSNYTYTSGDAGVKIFAVTLKTVGTRSITATDTVTGTITGTQSGITVNPAAASTLIVAGFPAINPSGTAGNFTVTAKDPYGNTATGYLGTVTFTSTDNLATLPSNYEFTAGDAGVKTFSATLLTAGTQSITVTDMATGSITGTQSGIIVTASTTTVLVGSLSPSVLGQNITLTATVNPGAPTQNPPSGTVTFFDNGVQIGTPVTLVGGVAVLDTASLTLGIHDITATYGGDTFFDTSVSNTVIQTVHQPIFFSIGGSNGTVQVYLAATGTLWAQFQPYGTGYSGGVTIAMGDVNGDGYDELITGTTVGNPHVIVYDGFDIAQGTLDPATSELASWFAYGTGFNVGVNVAVGDVNGDGYGDVVTGANAGNPHVKVFSGLDIANGTFNPSGSSLLASFFAYDVSFNVGVSVAAGQVDADGFADVTTGTSGGNPHIKVFSGEALTTGTGTLLLASWFAYGLEFNVGANVAVGDVDGDGFGDVITGASIGNPEIRVYSGQAIASGTFNPDTSVRASFFAYAVDQNIGVNVGAADYDGDGVYDILTGGTRGTPIFKVLSVDTTTGVITTVIEGIAAGLPPGIYIGG